MSEPPEPIETPDEAITARRTARADSAHAGWSVERRWLPRLGADTLWGRFRRRIKRTAKRADRAGDGIGGDLGMGCLDALADSFTAIVALIVVVLFLIFVLFPLVVAIVDVVILALLGLGGLVARLLFRRPWLIEARRDGEDTLRWRVVGWRASTERVAELRQSLAAGIVPPGAEVLPAEDGPDETRSTEGPGG